MTLLSLSLLLSDYVLKVPSCLQRGKQVFFYDVDSDAVMEGTFWSISYEAQHIMPGICIPHAFAKISISPWKEKIVLACNCYDKAEEVKKDNFSHSLTFFGLAFVHLVPSITEDYRNKAINFSLWMDKLSEREQKNLQACCPCGKHYCVDKEIVSHLI